MNEYSRHSKALAAVMNRMADSCPKFTWNNADWRIVPGTATQRGDLAAGGIVLNADLGFELLVSDFLSQSIPDAVTLKNLLLQSPLTYQGDNYKVVSVGIRPGGQQLFVQANSADQAAG